MGSFCCRDPYYDAEMASANSMEDVVAVLREKLVSIEKEDAKIKEALEPTPKDEDKRTIYSSCTEGDLKAKMKRNGKMKAILEQCVEMTLDKETRLGRVIRTVKDNLSSIIYFLYYELDSDEKLDRALNQYRDLCNSV